MPEEIVEILYRSIPEWIKSFLTIVKLKSNGKFVHDRSFKQNCLSYPPVKNFSLIESNTVNGAIRQVAILSLWNPGVVGM